MSLCFVILAAGQSKRMNSNLPKALHTLNGLPMLRMIIDRIKGQGVAESAIFVVVNYEKEQIKKYLQENNLKVNIVEQDAPIGTADAVKTALPFVEKFDEVAVLCTDVPLVDVEKVIGMSDKLRDADVVMLTANIDEPSGYGRVVRDEAGNIEKIVEQKDIVSADIQNICEVNTGILVATTEVLASILPKIKNNNAQNEYYLTDLIELANLNGFSVDSESADGLETFLGVNNYFQLLYLERLHKSKIILDLAKKGVRFLNPEQVEIMGEIEVIGRDIIISPNVVLKGKIKLGNNVVIESFNHLEDTDIGDDAVIKSYSYVVGATIKKGASVGPYAHIRTGSQLDEGSRVGAFTELKNAKIGKNSKVPHLAYVGDATIGEQTNIGAGVIVCNYDGKNKHQTKIGNRVFVGSNTSLVAPLEIVDDVKIGASSVITKDCKEAGLIFSKRENVFKKK